MTPKRIIPFFLLQGSRLVKGTQFNGLIDVGDPTSQAMIYDAQGADEIMVVDIAASSEGRVINPAIITGMMSKCHLPIGAGGGIRTIEDARKCFNAGADKIMVNSNAVVRPALVRELANEFGSQSVVVSIDVKQGEKGSYDIYIYSGKQKTDISLDSYLEQIISCGAGEIVVTSIDREGSLKGFDCTLHKKLRSLIPVPFIAGGGAGCYDDMVELFREADCDGCAIGKMLFLRDYDIVRIKAYLKSKKVIVREA